MTDIPAGAIQAAAKVLHAAGCALVSCIQADHPEIWNADKDLAADMLEAAAPYLAAAERERIRREARREAGNRHPEWLGSVLRLLREDAQP